MNLVYCNEVCPKGKTARDKFLDLNNSAFDAAMDFNIFVEDCYKTCPYKNEHNNSQK